MKQFVNKYFHIITKKYLRDIDLYSLTNYLGLDYGRPRRLASLSI